VNHVRYFTFQSENRNDDQLITFVIDRQLSFIGILPGRVLSARTERISEIWLALSTIPKDGIESHKNRKRPSAHEGEVMKILKILDYALRNRQMDEQVLLKGSLISLENARSPRLLN
jgi:hypothetical protein